MLSCHVVLQVQVCLWKLQITQFEAFQMLE